MDNNNLRICYHSQLRVILQSMVQQALAPKHMEIFPDLNDHYFDHEPGLELDHISQLIRKIAASFFEIRLKAYGKLYGQRVVHKGKPSRRHELSKLVLFLHQ